jgi:hypothetical protein
MMAFIFPQRTLDKLNRHADRSLQARTPMLYFTGVQADKMTADPSAQIQL